MSTTPLGVEVIYLRSYLEECAQLDPARYAGPFEAVLTYVDALDGAIPCYQPQAFRGFAHGLWAAGVIDLAQLDQVDQYQLEDPALNPQH
ncbi:conserved hypothetical protein [Pseudomonas veronii]|uniref:hypothetical protein n=1 Tax=Pseudomonas veronii TaxID=76761 RepID=UPI00174FF4C5|nr:hypothetical protein [Pseudomonas veronii]CAD0266047.1 conserved hypothetical protein [Pseudomonas veronii]